MIALRRTERLQQEVEPARSDRAGAAPGAEDGGGRPAVGRHRARLQQHAHRDPRQHRHGARAASATTIRASSACSTRRGRPRSAPPRWCSACWRSRASIRRRSRRSTSTGWCRACRNCCAGRIGETVTVETVLAGGLWKIAVDRQPARKRHPQSRRQCPRRDAGRRPADDRDIQLISRRSLCRRQQRRR